MAQAAAATGKKTRSRSTSASKTTAARRKVTPAKKPAPKTPASKKTPSKTAARKTVAAKKAAAAKQAKPKSDAEASVRAPSALRDEVVGIGILAASLCLMLALASFNLDDVSATGQAAQTGQARNLIGPVGAFVADILLYIFGAAAFLLPVTLAVPGLCLLTARRIRVRVVDAVGYPVLVFFGAMAAHLWMEGGSVLGHAAGGFIGSHGAEILKALFGETGAYILVYAVMALTFIVTTRISLVQLAGQAARPLASRAREAASKREADKLDARERRGEAKREAAESRAEAAARKAEEKREAAQKRAADKAARRAAKKAGANPEPLPESNAAAETIERAVIDQADPVEPESTADYESAEDVVETPAAPSLANRLGSRWRAARERRAEEKARHAAIRAALDAGKSPARELEQLDDDGAVEDGDSARWRMKRPARSSRGPATTGAFVIGGADARATSGFSIDGESRSAAPVAAPSSRKDSSRKASSRKGSTQRGRTLASTPNTETAAFAPTEAATTLQPVLNADDLGVEMADPIDRAAFTGEHDTVFAPAITGDMAAHRPAPAARATPAAPAAPTATRQPIVHDGPKRTDVQLDMNLGAETEDNYVFPPLKFLNFDAPEDDGVDTEYLQEQALSLVEALRTFKIDGEVTEIHPGPVVTMYEFAPAPGVRISRIANLADDLAMALKAIKVRIVAPIPGKGVVGFEVPNAKRQMVFLQEIIGSEAFRDKKLALPMALGKDIHGNASVTDLAKMPHLLVAGTTGSGKSVGVNCMITSLLYHASPDDVRFIMVDPKMLELSIYEGVPHLLLPVVTDSMKASLALKWAVDEMERRYALMKNAGVRSIRGFNKKVLASQTDGTTVHLEAELGEEPRKMPYIVVVIDEFADLMMVAGKEVEYCVARIAQKARAAGIHLILATQRPSTDVITGVIKANFPTRIAFRVSSGIDSRTILSTQGAENLLGKGDMLFLPPGTSRLDRVHGAFVSEDEIHQVVEFIKAQREPDYLDESILTAMDEGAKEDEGGDEDPMYEEAVRTVLRDGRASTSHLQRRLSLGYNRAARIVDQMERDGLVGGSRGSKPREINKQFMAELVQRWDET